MAWNGSKTSHEGSARAIKTSCFCQTNILLWMANESTAIHGQPEILPTHPLTSLDHCRRPPFQSATLPLDQSAKESAKCQVPRYGNSGGQLVPPGLRMECLDAEDRQQCLGTPVLNGTKPEAMPRSSLQTKALFGPETYRNRRIKTS